VVICLHGLCLLRCLQLYHNILCRRRCVHTTKDITGGGGGEVDCLMKNKGRGELLGGECSIHKGV
jgi:hypothetical protein